VAALVLAVVVAAFAAASAAAGEVVQPADRDVSPPGVMPLPSGDGPLIREPAPPRPPDPPRWRRYFLPQTSDAATFTVKDMIVHIAGVVALAGDHACAATDGGAWPCGQSALYALRRFLHGRAIECFFPYADGVTDVTAPCRVARIDLGLWLLQNGWAQPDDLATDAYRAAANAARCARLGVWREETPPADCPATWQTKS
jgi:endonuclease YncB( thermonuclease family)